MMDSDPFKRKDLNTNKGCIPAHSLLFMKMDEFTQMFFSSFSPLVLLNKQ